MLDNRTESPEEATTPTEGASRVQLTTFHKTKLAFMLASFLSLAFSVTLWALGDRMQAIFVGLWVPSIHSLGTLVLTGERADHG